MTADTIGGIWTYALELIRGLHPLGVQVALATMGAAPRPNQEREAAAIPNLDLYSSRYKLEWMDDPWREVEEAGEWLLGLQASTDARLAHLNGYSHAALPWKIPTLVAGHSCVLSWWSAVKGERAPQKWAHYQRAVRDGLQKTDLVISPSQSMLQELGRHYGPLHRAKVVANGRNADLFRPGKKEAMILSAGRLWDEAKNVGQLAAVAEQLDWPVNVAGDQRHPNGRMARLDRVHLLGSLSSEQMLVELQKAAIFALPARYEPFGLSILEAALCGCALVLGNIASLKEMWRGAALFVSPDDPDELRDALQWLIKHGSARQELARTARKRAAQHTPERMAAAYLGAYREVLESCARGHPPAAAPASPEREEAACAS
jgi:glycogen synthase